MSKGSNRRPSKVSDDRFAESWAKVFGVSEVVQNEAVANHKSQSVKEGASLSVLQGSGKHLPGKRS